LADSLYDRGEKDEVVVQEKWSKEGRQEDEIRAGDGFEVLDLSLDHFPSRVSEIYCDMRIKLVD
jgi:hypothetical protein